LIYNFFIKFFVAIFYFSLCVFVIFCTGGGGGIYIEVPHAAGTIWVAGGSEEWMPAPVHLCTTFYPYPCKKTYHNIIKMGCLSMGGQKYGAVTGVVS